MGMINTNNLIIKGAVKGKWLSKNKTFTNKNIISSGEKGSGVFKSSITLALQSCNKNQSLIVISDNDQIDLAHRLDIQAKESNKNFNYLFINTQEDEFKLTIDKTPSLTLIQSNVYLTNSRRIDVINNTSIALQQTLKRFLGVANPPCIMLDINAIGPALESPLWNIIKKIAISTHPFWIVEHCLSYGSPAYHQLIDWGFFHVVHRLDFTPTSHQNIKHFNYTKPMSFKNMAKGECHIFGKEHLLKGMVLKLE